MSTLSRVIFDPDVTPPSTPTNLVGTPVSSTRIDLSWSASIDTGGSGLAGYLVYRAGVFLSSASSTAYSDTGLTASTSYQYQVAAVDAAGNVSTLSTLIAVTTQANAGPPVFAPTQPTAAFIGIAGVRSFTDPAQISAIGRYNFFVTGIWEAWANSGRDFDTTTKAIKAASTAPTPTLVFGYINLNAIEEDANDPRPTWTTEVVTRSWKLYVTGSSGALVTPNSGGGATALVNYTDFVPVNPSLEHPYEFGAKYSYFIYLSKTKSDARFTGINSGLASSSLDGIFQDNFLLNPQVNGDWNRDGSTEVSGLPCTATPWLCAGHLRYVNAMRSIAPTKYVFANAGDYGVSSSGVMIGQLDGMLCESYMGKSWSRETQNPFTTVLQYYYNALAAARNPHLVIFGGSWPDPVADPSSLPKNTQWQWARYIAATAYLGEGMPAINQFDFGYSSDLAALDWYDFYGGVNGLARSWLGAPVDTLRPTTPKIAKGSIGIFGVEYQNGIVLVNPKGNGTQTVTNADIPGSWKFLTGTQDPTRDSGATFSSVSMPERDGLFLKRIASVFAPNFATLSNGTMTTRIDRQFNKTDSVLGTLPPAGIHGTDQYGQTWNPISAPGFTSGVAPIIDTPANLSSIIGATIPILPDGNATCMAIKYPSGYPAGFVPFDIECSPTGSVCNRLYVSCWVLMPSNFSSQGNNIKWFNFQNTAPKSNHIFMLDSFDTTSDGRASWMVLQGTQSGSYGGQSSNAPGAITALHAPPGTGVGWWPSNKGTWHCLEWFVQRESNPGVSADGVFVGAFDGTIINKWTNVTFNAPSGDSNGFNFCGLIPYWGGGGSAASTDRHICLGRMLIAQGN